MIETQITPEKMHFDYPVRVFYEDTDAGGVVYYANYLKFAERARTEFLRKLDVHQRKMAEDPGVFFVVRRCEADYRAPAHLDDLLTVGTRLASMRNASLVMHQEIHRKEQLLVAVKTVIACITTQGRPRRFPEEFAQTLAPYVPAKRQA